MNPNTGRRGNPELRTYCEHHDNFLKITEASLFNENIFYIIVYNIVSNTYAFSYLFPLFQGSGETLNQHGLGERFVPVWILVCVCSVTIFL